MIICTDVLKEGVDLHLFCDRVVHYGLAFSPGDLEQRTGRVDRYFSKVHRDILAAGEGGERRLGIGYPFMPSTLDELQLARVLSRRDAVQELMDRGLPMPRFEANMAAEGKAEEVETLLRKPDNVPRSDPFPAAAEPGATRVHVVAQNSWHDMARDHLQSLLEAFRGRYQTDGVDSSLEGKLDSRLFRMTVGVRGRGKAKRLASKDEPAERRQSLQVRLEFIGQYQTHILRARSWITEKDAGAVERLLDSTDHMRSVPYGIGVALIWEHKRSAGRETVNSLVAESSIPFASKGQICTRSPEELADLIGRVTLTADFYEEQIQVEDRAPAPEWSQP